jgi:hypothetical protein
VSTAGVLTGIRAFSTDGSVHHLLVTGGVQWDLARAVTVGATVTPPGIRIGGSSKIRFTQTLFQAAGTTQDLAFRDPEAKFDYRIPFRAMARNDLPLLSWSGRAGRALLWRPRSV